MPNPDTIYVAKDMGPQIVTYDDTGSSLSAAALKIDLHTGG